MLSKNQEDIQTFIQTERLESEVMPSNQLNIQQENNNFIQSENLFTEQEILEKNKTRFNVKDGQETENYVEGDLKIQEKSWKDFNFNMNTNWFQCIFFVDLLRLLFHCKKFVKSKNEMQLNDIPHLFPEDQICQISQQFEIFTEKERNRLNSKGKEIGAMTNLINDIAHSAANQKQYMWASIITIIIVDQSLPLTSIDSLEVLCSHVVMLVMLIVINPYFLIIAFVMILMLYYFLVISKIFLIQSK
ncbi:hypothetical protein ABPG72_005852 [Tetrahymena utriculariae]